MTELEKARLTSKVKFTTDVTEKTLENVRKLAKIIASGADVCFLTGAGLSISSGITPYRYSA